MKSDTYLLAQFVILVHISNMLPFRIAAINSGHRQLHSSPHTDGIGNFTFPTATANENYQPRDKYEVYEASDHDGTTYADQESPYNDIAKYSKCFVLLLRPCFSIVKHNLIVG